MASSPIIGSIADLTNLRVGIGMVVVAGIVVVLLAGAFKIE
jgi:hypothetical protein